MKYITQIADEPGVDMNWTPWVLIEVPDGFPDTVVEALLGEISASDLLFDPETGDGRDDWKAELERRLPDFKIEEVRLAWLGE